MAAPRKATRMKLAKKGQAQSRASKGAPVGSYPTDTKKRARSAKAYASAAVNAGRMARSTEASIDKRANKKLGKKGDARRTK